MAAPRRNPENPLRVVDLQRCCPEAQADGVPCPTLGRSCEICERAIAPHAEDPPITIRPAGRD